MIWIITAMLWHVDVEGPSYSTYSAQTFSGKVECLDYVFWNKAELVYELAEVHGKRNGQNLRTWAFFCEGRELDEV